MDAEIKILKQELVEAQDKKMREDIISKSFTFTNKHMNRSQLISKEEKKSPIMQKEKTYDSQ